MYLLELKTADMLLVYFIHTHLLCVVIAQHNLTPNGTATQSTYYTRSSGKPEYAIYPPISNKFSLHICSYTHYDRFDKPAWWMFQFSFGNAYITDITIYYRESFARRMDGFKLCVTNTSTIPPDSGACYEDPDPGLPNTTQSILFNQLGKYVIYYDDKGSTELNRYDGPVVELCYVAINGCQKSFWGHNCESPCAENCIEGNCFPGNGSCIWGCNPIDCLNDLCNKDTAVCTVGCNKRKTGYYCNKYNLASDSLVTQSPRGSLVASLAIDGNKSSCSRTLGHTVTFQIDLIEESIVTGMLLTSREHITTGGNYSVYASNASSSWKSGTVLYKGTSLPSEINFLEVFRYLTLQPPLQQPYASLELCEIGIVGCPPSHYGPVCTKLCPPKCQGPCDLGSGNCIFGCLNGWTGDKCEQACALRRYGQNCSEGCSDNCLNPQCNHETGECIDGCRDGWQGFNCTQECSNGKFGTNCLKFCEGCVHHACDPVDGLCDNTTICNPGYVNGDYCNRACNNWYFGTNCSTECNCLVEPCNKVDGMCPFEGCKEGWHGESCNQRCFKGFWGDNCGNTCSPNCMDQQCYPGNGSCVWGCDPQNCLNRKCDIYKGTCTEGCVSGLSGQYCNTFLAKTMESNSVLPTQVSLFIGGVLFGVLVTVAVSFLVQRKRQLQKTQGKEKSTVNTQSHEQQQYDDVQHVQMENVSTYQDLMTPQTLNVYDQINSTYVNQ